MVDMSILLPSLRPNAALRFVNWINGQSVPISYEIILISPFKLDESNVIWMKDEGPNTGSLRPMNDGYRKSQGRYISVASDDAPYDVGWWTIIEFIQNLPADRKYRLASYSPSYMRFFKQVYNHPFLRNLPFLPKFHPRSMVHGVPLPCWYCIERETMPLLGGTPVREGFQAHCGDCDLGLRLHWAGEPVQFCSTARVINSGDIDDGLHQKNVSQFEDEDIDLLNSIWGDIYGRVPKTSR